MQVPIGAISPFFDSLAEIRRLEDHRRCIPRQVLIQREVMQLRDIEGYTYKEIGETLEIDINLVKTNLFRARRKLKESLIKENAYGL